MKCAKCRKAEGIHKMGMASYRGQTFPMLCDDCYRKWHEYLREREERLSSIYGAWQNIFEKWIGYKWLDIEMTKPFVFR
jgi:hypothetical protein